MSMTTVDKTKQKLTAVCMTTVDKKKKTKTTKIKPNITEKDSNRIAEFKLKQMEWSLKEVAPVNKDGKIMNSAHNRYQS